MIISKTEFLYRAQLDQETLELWIGEEWLIPVAGDADLLFSEADLARAQLIWELKRDMGVNDEGVGVILSLLDQVHSLRSALAEVLRSTHGQGARPVAEVSDRGDED